MYDAITVGSATVDVFARTDSELIKIKTVHHQEELIAFPCGSKILMNDLFFLTGGGGTNVAVSLAKLDHKVAYLGKVGKDVNGKIIQKMLKENKVKFIGKVSRKHLSGYSVILDSIEGDRTILAHKGANNYLKFSSINKKNLKTKWFYFSSMMNESYLTLEKISKYASKNKINIAFNPSNYLAEKGKEYLNDVLKYTKILILNKEEANLITNKKEIKEMILDLQSMGPSIVVITHGKKGVYTIYEGIFYHIIPNKINATETTGAGDSFASGFLSGWIRKKGIKYSLIQGMVIAQSVIQKIGAKNGLLTRNQALNQSKKIKFKIKKSKI